MFFSFHFTCSISLLKRFPLQVGHFWLMFPKTLIDNVITPAPSHVWHRPTLLLNENAPFANFNSFASGVFANKSLILSLIPVYVDEIAFASCMSSVSLSQ